MIYYDSFVWIFNVGKAWCYQEIVHLRDGKVLSSLMVKILLRYYLLPPSENSFDAEIINDINL